MLYSWIQSACEENVAPRNTDVRNISGPDGAFGLDSYPGAGWGWQNSGAGCRNTWTGSATRCSRRSCGSPSAGGRCGSARGPPRRTGGRSASTPSACSTPRAASRTCSTPPRCGWRRRSRIWACSGSGSPRRRSRSPWLPRRGGGTGGAGRGGSPGEETAKPRLDACRLSTLSSQPWVRPKVHRTARKRNHRGRGSPAREFSLTLSVRAPTYAPTLEWSKFVQEVLSSGADREEGQGWGWWWGPEGSRSLGELPHLLASANTAATETSECGDFPWVGGGGIWNTQRTRQSFPRRDTWANADAGDSQTSRGASSIRCLWSSWKDGGQWFPQKRQRQTLPG